MSETSARLSLPFLAASQAQKHVTHNEALRLLDLWVQLVIEGFDADTPPVAPEDGQIWATGAAPTGDWAGQPHSLAIRDGEFWQFTPLVAGCRALSRVSNTLLLWAGNSWQPLPPHTDNLEGLGIKTSFDATNRLSLAAAASLFSHAPEGGGHQLKLNKALTEDTASLLFQTGWSGRAEMGTTGDDAFAIKVSADGTNWQTGLRFDPTNGQVQAPSGLSVTGSITGSAVQDTPSDATAERLMTVGAFGLGLHDQSAALPPDDSLDDLQIQGFWRYGSATIGAPSGAGMMIHFTRIPSSSFGGMLQMAISHLGDVYFRARAADGWNSWSRIWQNRNTTVDANGFLKEASPILRLSDTGIEAPADPLEATFEKPDVGHYQLRNVPPLAGVGWQIEVPQDANGNRLVFVQTRYDATLRCLDIHTSAVRWEGAWVAGAAKDIPAARWIDLRFSNNPTPKSEKGDPE